MRTRIICLALYTGFLFTSCQNQNAESQKEEAGKLRGAQGDVPSGELWAAQVESQTDLRKPEGWSDADWNATAKGIEKEKILKAVTEAVLSGKLQAYNYAYDSVTFTVNEVQTMMEGINANDLVHVRMKEQWTFDPVQFNIEKKVKSIALFTNYISSEGEVRGMKPLFYVKINE